MPTRILLEHRDGSKGSFFLGRKHFGCLTVMAKATKQNGEEKRAACLCPFPLFRYINAVLYHFFFHSLWRIHECITPEWQQEPFHLRSTMGLKHRTCLVLPCIPCKMRQWPKQKEAFSCGLYVEHWLGQSHWVSHQHNHCANRTNKESTRSGFFSPLLVSANREVQFALCGTIRIEDVCGT